jgi:quinol monooxygenase YgiN
VAIAYLQEFVIVDGDTSTTNYDAVSAALNLQDAPDGLLIHTAGFDHDAGVFRIFDVWESEEAWNAFLQDRLMPVVEPLMEQGGRPPETRTYRLDDFMAAPGAGA